MRALNRTVKAPVVAAVLVAALAATPAVAVPAAGTHARCPAAGKTVVRTSEARIWRVRPKSGINEYYGCAVRFGRVVRLDPPHGQLIESPTKVKLAGWMAAYEAMDFDLKPFRVIVRSLRTGKVVHSAPSNRKRSSEGHTGPVYEITLRRDGSVRWTASVDCICEGTTSSGTEVHTIDRNGRHRIISATPSSN